MSARNGLPGAETRQSACGRQHCAARTPFVCYLRLRRATAPTVRSPRGDPAARSRVCTASRSATRIRREPRAAERLSRRGNRGFSARGALRRPRLRRRAGVSLRRQLVDPPAAAGTVPAQRPRAQPGARRRCTRAPGAAAPEDGVERARRAAAPLLGLSARPRRSSRRPAPTASRSRRSSRCSFGP